MLIDIWLLDAELGGMVAQQPWVIGQQQPGDFSFHRSGYVSILGSLYDLATMDPELAKLLVGAPWFTDGLTYDESQLLRATKDLAAADIGLARMVADFPWFVTSSLDSWAIDPIISLSRGGLIPDHIELAQAAVRYWFGEVATIEEAMYSFSNFAPDHTELAWRVLTLPWSVDGIQQCDNDAIFLLSLLAEEDIELVKRAINHPSFSASGLLAFTVVSVYWKIAMDADSALTELVSEPWFADGLSDSEAYSLKDWTGGCFTPEGAEI